MNRLVMDPTQIRQPVARGALGLNVNFLADHAEMRQHGQGYLAALKQMGVRSLRYPGGEKSNEVFWSQPPWREARPTLSLTGSAARLFKESKLVSETGEFRVKPMDFDEFMGLCHAVNAEPILCVGLGSAYIQNQPGRVGSTRQQVIENAVEWVRYANQVRGYGIKYWELGNESYWRGSIATLTAAEYTRDVLELSRAMKAIDPAIHIGVNGHVDRDSLRPRHRHCPGDAHRFAPALGHGSEPRTLSHRRQWCAPHLRTAPRNLSEPPALSRPYPTHRRRDGAAFQGQSRRHRLAN